MSRFFDYTYSRADVPGQRRRTIKTDIKVGPVSLKFVTLIIITLLTLFYFAYQSTGATKGYELKDLDQKEQQLEQENSRLKVEAARLQAIAEINKSAKDQGLVPVDKVEYVK